MRQYIYATSIIVFFFTASYLYTHIAFAQSDVQQNQHVMMPVELDSVAVKYILLDSYSYNAGDTVTGKIVFVNQTHHPILNLMYYETLASSIDYDATVGTTTSADPRSFVSGSSSPPSLDKIISADKTILQKIQKPLAPNTTFAEVKAPSALSLQPGERKEVPLSFTLPTISGGKDMPFRITAYNEAGARIGSNYTLIHVTGLGALVKLGSVGVDIGKDPVATTTVQVVAGIPLESIPNTALYQVSFWPIQNINLATSTQTTINLSPLKNKTAKTLSISTSLSGGHITPGMYQGRASIVSAPSVSRQSSPIGEGVDFSFTMSGLNASIQSLDLAGTVNFSKNDTLPVRIFWSPIFNDQPASENASSSPYRVILEIKNEKGTIIGTSSASLSSIVQTLQVPLQSRSNTIVISAVIVGDGALLAEYKKSFTDTTPSSGFALVVGTLIALLVLIAAWVLYLKRKGPFGNLHLNMVQ